jgi:hypothetical protein
MPYPSEIYTEERPQESWSDEEIKAEMDAYYAFDADVRKRGIHQGGEALQGTETATTVRVRGGDVLTTDGPFAETKEQLGGFYLVDCRDLDQAIEVASKIPSATHGSIEVRPIMEFPEAPEG